MTAFFHGFVSEIEKLASDDELKNLLRRARKDRTDDEKDFNKEVMGGRLEKGKNYATLMALGALTSPAVDVVGNAVGQRIDAGKGLAANRSRPLIGKASMNPRITHGNLAASAVRGALLGSVIQAIKDKYSDGPKSPA